MRQLTLAELLLESNISYLSEIINPEDFPEIGIRGQLVACGESLLGSRNIDSCLILLNHLGLVPATLYELVYFADHGWDKRVPITADNSFIKLGGKRYSPVLLMQGCMMGIGAAEETEDIRSTVEFCAMLAVKL